MNLIELQSYSRAFTMLMFGSLLRWSILAALCGLLALLLKSTAAEIRHLLWRGLLFALLLLPVLEMIEPPLQRASQTLSRVELAVLPAAPQATVGRPTRTSTLIVPATPPRDNQFFWLLMPAIYLLVAFLFLARLLASLIRLKRLVNRSEFIPDLELRQLAHEVWLDSYAFRRPRIRVSAEVCVPVAINLDEALILLPVSWRQWPQDKLRAVLMHEMAHVRRDDPGTALVASLATCFFWMHPLTWFLKRHLAGLAEEACDEVALRTVSTAEQYARILVDFAADVAGHGGKIFSASSAAVHGSQVRKRLERIFAPVEYRYGNQRAIRALLVAISLPALYLTAAARLDEPQTQHESVSKRLKPVGTPEEAAQRELDLQTDPDDLEKREDLMAYYVNERQSAEFTRHLLWVIEHHPESPGAAMRLYITHDNPLGMPEEYQLVKVAWERALALHPASADVLFHAGLFLEQSDPERALTLFRRALNLSSPESRASEEYVQAIAGIYRIAVITDVHYGDPRLREAIAMDLDLAIKLRKELESSNDPLLLSDAGTMLVQSTPDNEIDLGLDFIKKAIALDPGNPKWEEALESAKAEPIRRRNREQIVRSRRPLN